MLNYIVYNVHIFLIMVNNKNITWNREPNRPLILRAQLLLEPLQFDMWLEEADMTEVQYWCSVHRCGRRISYDMFKFRNEAEITMFLLKWS
jgi:hypothetical protein